MKRFAFSLALLTPFFFAACSSDSSSDTPDPTGAGTSAGGTAGSGGDANGGTGGTAGTQTATGGHSGIGGTSAGAGGSTGGTGGSVGGSPAGGHGGQPVGGKGGAAGVGGGPGPGPGQGGGGAGGAAGEGGSGGNPVGGSGGSGGVDVCNLPLMMTPPPHVSDIGLYIDNASGTTQPYARAYAPNYKLWSDGATKRRFVYLPCGSTVNTADMDVWLFPVGTRAWKEFTYMGKRVETRIVHRYGPGDSDYIFASYQWRDDQTEADLVPTGGSKGVMGTDWDIPSQGDCGNCHGKLASTYLSLGAIQLSDATGGLALADWKTEGVLSKPGQDSYPSPFDTETTNAVGYLHANCGGCHNPTGVNSLHMRLTVGDTTIESTQVYKSAVGVSSSFTAPGIDHRIVAGDSDHSAIPYRMGQRGDAAQMPPIATKHVDDLVGVPEVKKWIDNLPPSTGGSGGSGGAGGSG